MNNNPNMRTNNAFANNAFANTRTNVSVSGLNFSIPSDRVNEVLNLLTRLQSIQLTENNPTPPLQWQGKTLINE